MTFSSLEFQRIPTWRHVRRAGRAVHSIWIRYQRHQQRQCALVQLAEMDDRSLTDIGISRCQVRAAIRSGIDPMSWYR